ncbi:hypothetical protein O4G76_14865 [Limimaricola sp. G21655-S1]|uniref:hypothetical protein n=1 Tax=Limimaricola sp. G21655-S1 TaxID=3014768 RepID=UPI0022B06C0A|nr:hypothetical protein [Limimaricola sp. G21655-S1]MCZ4262125.1 hypothetical protein [Limimaricola sp. G21655-S1]
MIRTTTTSPAYIALRAFLRDHDEALQNAALLLGDSPALRRTQRLLGAIDSQPILTRRLCRELAALRALLSLEHVGDPDRLEAACFARIDLAWHGIEEICLLEEGLVRCLDRLEAEALDTAPLWRAA